jgi:hypothetical protein
MRKSNAILWVRSNASAKDFYWAIMIASIIKSRKGTIPTCIERVHFPDTFDNIWIVVKKEKPGNSEVEVFDVIEELFPVYRTTASSLRSMAQWVCGKVETPEFCRGIGEDPIFEPDNAILSYSNETILSILIGSSDFVYINREPWNVLIDVTKKVVLGDVATSKPLLEGYRMVKTLVPTPRLSISMDIANKENLFILTKTRSLGGGKIILIAPSNDIFNHKLSKMEGLKQVKISEVIVYLVRPDLNVTESLEGLFRNLSQRNLIPKTAVSATV